MPYDQLLREFVAGDLLEPPRLNTELGINESAIGPAHLRMVPHGFGVTDAYQEQVTFIDNQIDVLTKTTLGLTVSCARCHDHKFDPISQKDYTRLYGVLVSARPASLNADAPARQQTHVSELRAIKARIREALANHWTAQLGVTLQRLEASDLGTLSKTDPLFAYQRLSNLAPNQWAAELQRLLEERERDLAHNERARRSATFHADLRDPETYATWFQDGNGLSAQVSPAGSFALAAEGEHALTGIYPRGIYSHLISDKHSAILHSVFHRAQGKHNLIRGLGHHATVRFCVRSYPLEHGGLHPMPKLPARSRWVEIPKYAYWNGEQGYYVVNTNADRTSRGPTHARSWFGVTEVYAGEHRMRDTTALEDSLASKLERARTRDGLGNAYTEELREALRAWKTEPAPTHKRRCWTASCDTACWSSDSNDSPLPSKRSSQKPAPSSAASRVRAGFPG